MNTRRLAVVATAVLATFAVAGGASAAPLTGVRTRFSLTLADGERAWPAQYRASLTCAPDGGSHRYARLACAELTKVDGDFGALQVEAGACTMQYQPVTVTANGRWQGRKVRFQRTYGNGCALAMQAGPVFRL